MKPEKFTAAMHDATPSPCEKYECPHLDRCAKEEIACRLFFHYVKFGRFVHAVMAELQPTPEMFRAAMQCE